ncbi:MAG: hypothetical protein MHPSP_000541 [Paramarteilia canceri]
MLASTSEAEFATQDLHLDTEEIEQRAQIIQDLSYLKLELPDQTSFNPENNCKTVEEKWPEGNLKLRRTLYCCTYCWQDFDSENLFHSHVQKCFPSVGMEIKPLEVPVNLAHLFSLLKQDHQ